jgi:hypothetical protein
MGWLSASADLFVVSSLLCAELFINYKLKSVAHLPLKVFVYRACNTFIGQSKGRGWTREHARELVLFKSHSLSLSSVLSSPDDLFAFIIYTPLLHRIACFRDDIIFFVYLYQRWIYPVDHSRTLKLDDDEEDADEKSATGEAKEAVAVAEPSIELQTEEAATQSVATLAEDEASGSEHSDSEGDVSLKQRRPVTADTAE